MSQNNSYRYIITYDLAANRTSARRYQRLYERIQSYEHVWIAKSVWVISTDETGKEVRDYLKVGLGRNDKLLVGILGDWASWGVDRPTANLLRALRP